MNFVALLLGLGIERLLTHLFHLREFRWLDPVIDRVLGMLDQRSRITVLIGVIVLTLLLIAPVALTAFLLTGALYQIPYFAVAVIVLLFSLGPRDLKEEVADYCAAVEANSEEDLQSATRELTEDDSPEDPVESMALVERAVFIQANNRIFGVVFWFLLLGPTGAWLFRVLDLMRRRLSFRASRHTEAIVSANTVWAVRTLHGVFAWLPARLLSVGYAMAGSFDDALSGWRNYSRDPEKPFFEISSEVMACIGCSAVGGARDDEQGTKSSPIRRAMDLVGRTLWLIWCPIIAILTLSDWLT